MQVFECALFFSSFGEIPSSAIAKLYDIDMFSFTKNPAKVSSQIAVPFAFPAAVNESPNAPHPHQGLVLSVSWALWSF